MEQISPRLKTLVDQSVTLLGEVVRAEMGEAGYRLVETVRAKMAALRPASDEAKAREFRRVLARLDRLRPGERLDFARAFTLMLELMNACENAYRNFSIQEKPRLERSGRPDAVIYVLTAHPTEARAPENIWVFHEIQGKLTAILRAGSMEAAEREELRHLLLLAWRVPIVRARKPRVQDEAEHIFSTLLRAETLRPLLAASRELAPIYVRSWVGGDKDGHPGVNEVTFRDSLQLSRALLLRFVESEWKEFSKAVEAAHLGGALRAPGRSLLAALRGLRQVRAGDGDRMARLRKGMRIYALAYEEEVGLLHPALRDLERLLRIFPGLVVPLEFRESSDMLGEPPIRHMLEALRTISRGGDPRWYARGFVISMTRSFENIETAATLVRRVFGALRLPVVPLFEQAEDLAHAPHIVRQMLASPLRKAASEFGHLEIMVGYSDSSKESGVLPSRLELAETMHELDRLCRREGVMPIFFQGSGGSVDRGGGSIPEQTAWWPAGALRNYKVTVQGEMVERSFASPEITWRQFERIAAAAGEWKKRWNFRYRASAELREFASSVAGFYRGRVADPAFLRLIEAATPYSFLDRLRIGSRPSKRKNLASVSDLRAIPWVLCWTQTRVLFPTWWGVGSAWEALGPRERRALRAAYGRDPVFSVFVRALAYTMAKVELGIWELYLERSSLSPAERAVFSALFRDEARKAKAFLRAIGAEPIRPWLFESISLRSPMIHPLNLLQLIALKRDEKDLLRITVTGIANGMVSTG